jgi:hypothetical protein
LNWGEKKGGRVLAEGTSRLEFGWNTHHPTIIMRTIFLVHSVLQF